MAPPFTLFEVSWEVCNKIGGIHTVLSTKAKTLVERFGDDYVAIGPWRLSEPGVPFEDDPGYEDFAESCRQMGLPVRVGRWTIPGRPRTVLVEFSKLYEEKDGILSGLWEDFQVDSISGGWDYVEPVLFGYAAGKVIERWWDEYLAPYRRRGVAHAHEWLTGSALLYVKKHVPILGTIFTTHATVLGRALSSLGQSPEEGLGERTVEELAEEHNVVAKHSLEGVVAREADVFTTVSEITADEAELLHDRRPDPLTYNGIDLEVIDALAGDIGREEMRDELGRLASHFVGEDVRDAAHLCISGRYEFHNKGIDVLLEALADMNGRAGRPLVAWILVPAGNTGEKSELMERLDAPLDTLVGPMGISTHNLFDEQSDPIHEHCERLVLDNAQGSRVRVVHVPIYLAPGDGFFDQPYEAVLRAMDLSCFPSYYEPWGYTPQESLAVGVPTVTSDYAGFGLWAAGLGLGPEEGITVLLRHGLERVEVVAELDQVLEGFLREGPPMEDIEATCRATAARSAWSDFIENYITAYDDALAQIQQRMERGAPPARRARVSHPVQPAAGSVPHLVPFDVSATLPESLRGFDRLARNFWWCWDPEAPTLFAELSPETWETCGHNPIPFLRRVPADDLQRMARDEAYVARLERVLHRFQDYTSLEPAPLELGEGMPALTAEHPIAYFCAEYGIHESLPIYSGGLGVLAGDHLKSASDLRLPFLAVGMFYSHGYLTQRVTPTGEQVGLDSEYDVRELPLERLKDEGGKPLEIRLHFPGRSLVLRVLRARVGRVPLYLLDANCPSNRPEDREITSRLYGGDQEMRIQQEIVLSRGGQRLLQALDIEPAVYHLNEGHAAFLTVERIAHLMRKAGLTFEEASELVRATTAFTTHTPVPAGHDRFGEDTLRRYFSDAPERLGVPWESLLALGQSPTELEDFNMTYLALRFSSFCNGVSRLHGAASRRLLHPVWPALLESEVPVESITNGVHLASWTQPEVARLVGASDRPVTGEDFAERAGSIDLAELWRIKGEAKARLIGLVRENLRSRMLDQHDSPLLLTRMQDGLDQRALLVAFARRFAPYKRAQLLFREPERIRALLEDDWQPLRILIAGKAHPADGRGKEILREIAELSRREEFAGKVIFVEDYDIETARALVQGVDVWLNNPTRMLEASGTSGMKAAANGVLNLSIADGWWPEASDGENGWTIANGRVYEDQELQDQLDSEILYRLFEEEVLPAYFERDEAGVPLRWMERVRHNLATIPPVFNSDRMVGEYRDRAYRPLGRSFFALSRDRRAPVKELAAERSRVRRGFAEVEIVEAVLADLAGLQVGDPIDVQVRARLGALAPEDVVVELVLGAGTGEDDLEDMRAVALAHEAADEEAVHAFRGVHRMESSGVYSYGIRVRPRSATETGDSLRDLVVWG